VVPKVLPYPEDIELFNGGDHLNSSAMQNPVAYIQKALDSIGLRQCLLVYKTLTEALAEREKSIEYAHAVMCLSATDLSRYFDWYTREASVMRKLDIDAPKVKATKIYSQRETIPEPESLELIIQDDYVKLSQVSRLTTPIKEPLRFDEKDLIAACQESRLNIMWIHSEVMALIAKRAVLSPEALVQLFQGDKLSRLPTAIAVVMITGQHECLYNDEVYQVLCSLIPVKHGKWLPRFFEQMREAVTHGGFSAKRYAELLTHADNEDFRGCNSVLECALIEYRRRKIAILDKSIERELSTAFTFLAATKDSAYDARTPLPSKESWSTIAQEDAEPLDLSA
jgi:hypothetical protein